MNFENCVICRHYEPGTWVHPQASEMGLRPDVRLTVEMHFMPGEVWQKIKANGIEVYFAPIVGPRQVEDSDDDDDDN